MSATSHQLQLFDMDLDMDDDHLLPADFDTYQLPDSNDSTPDSVPEEFDVTTLFPEQACLDSTSIATDQFNSPDETRAPGSSLSLLLLPRSGLPLAQEIPRNSRISSKNLEDLSINIIMVLNRPTLDDPAYDYLLPSLHSEFCAHTDGPTPKPVVMLTRERFISLRHDLAMRHPGFRVDVTDAISTVNEKRGTATVWVTSWLSQYKLENMKPRESVAVFEWKLKNKSDWICTSTSFMHGYFE